MKIKIEDTTKFLTELLEKRIAKKSKSWIEYALDSILEFKAQYEIENLSTEEETDELLAEYGIERDKFVFMLTRQVQLEGEEEFYQIQLILFFSVTNFTQIKSENFWTIDFDNDLKWKAEVEQTEAYIKASKHEILSYEIIIDET